MARAAILEKYAHAIAESERNRQEVRRGVIDEAEIVLRRGRRRRQIAGHCDLIRRGRFDLSRYAAVVADLVDDGLPDWAYWLDKPGRRYRLRPWRTEDGAPWSYKTPCITVLDSESSRKLLGIPAGAFLLLGHRVKLEDTDACCEQLFVVSRRRRAPA